MFGGKSNLGFKFLLQASLLYKDICPEQSRFLMRIHQIQSKAPVIAKSMICPFCFQWQQLGNHHVRLRPKRKPTARIRKLLKRESAGKRLTAEQTVVLRKFKRASNALMATCHTCNKMSRQPGMNREFLATLSQKRSTPGSAGKPRTPQSVNRTPKSAVNRTPSGTPRSGSSNTSSASKTGSAKSSPFARLKKILMLENKQSSKKGGLKDFLSSL
ncbi:hypothetical protein ABG768_011727 [Culter alburnus]|uniref:Uncharacterized protein n=1 Tax=Culter alburnus TaxID=194366 RepID=A0AAW1Z991_CULAL